MVDPYMRCVRCGSPIRKRGRTKYCKHCKKQIKRENSRKYRRKRKDLQEDYIKMISKDLPTANVDETGKQFIDLTHAQWDVIPTPHGTKIMVGTITEWELDKRIHLLMKKVDDEKLKNVS